MAGKGNTQIPVRGKNGLTAYVSPEMATVLLNAQPSTQSGSVAVVGKNLRAIVTPEQAAFLMGAKLANGGHNSAGNGIQFAWENHAIWMVTSNRKVKVADTKVPASKTMSAFLRIAAELAGVPAGDMQLMFPTEPPMVVALQPKAAAEAVEARAAEIEVVEDVPVLDLPSAEAVEAEEGGGNGSS